MKDTTPKWFQNWRDNEFKHLKLKVNVNYTLSWIILGAIIGGAIAIILRSYL